MVEPVELRTVQIGDVTARAASVDPKKKFVNVFTYIDLSSVNQSQKEISDTKKLEPSEAPSRARQVVQTSDVLISTVRPNLNGVAVVPDVLDGAIASTGFTVLRPITSKILPAYLFQWVKSPLFVDDMISRATGASYPAVSDKIVRESFIPLPPLPEQRRISAILDKVDHLRTQRRESLAHLEALTQSIFDELTANANDWAMVPLESLVAPGKSMIRTGPFGSQLLTSEFVGDGIAVLGIDNAVSNTFEWKQRRFISEEKYEQLKRYTVHPGDLIITIMGTLGRSAVIPADIPIAINTKHLCCITLNRELVVPEYVHAYFLQHEEAARHLRQTTKGSIMGGLNMGIIKAMPVVVPPLELQQTFAKRVTGVERLKEQHRAQLTELDTLFASLQHRAFSGQL